MNYRDLLKYGFYEDNNTYTVVLDKYRLKINNINLEEKKDEIKSFFNANNIEVSY